MTYSNDSLLSFSLSSAKMTPPPPHLPCRSVLQNYFSLLRPGYFHRRRFFMWVFFMKDWQRNNNILCQRNARFVYHVILYIHKNIIPSGALCMLVSPSKFTGRPKWEAIVRVRQNRATLARFDRNSSLRWPQSMWVLVIAFFSWGDLTDFYDFRCP